MPTSKNLDSLVINKVESQEVYEWMKANNKTNEDELYLTPDASDSITVDSKLSATSTNPVQNKVIKSALDGKLSTSGGTLTGNLTGKYITGSRLKTTDASELSTTPTKIPVLDSEGWIYYRTLEHLKSDLGVGSGTGGQGQDGKSVNWRGEYGASTTYNKLDAVSYNGSSYIYSSSTSASGKIPGIDTEWDLMAEKGQDGSPGADGSPGIVISSTQPTSDSHPVWLDPNGDASTENPLNITGATVGQIAKISAVDENGVPTAWEPVDMPSGGGLQWIEVVDITTEEQTQKLTISVDKDGRPISQYNALWMVFSILFPADASQTSTSGAAWIYPFPKLGDNAYRYIASVPGWKTVTRTLTYAWAGLPRLPWSSAMAGQTTFGTDGDPDFLSGLCVYLSSSSDHIPVGTRVRIAVLSKGVTA